MKAEHDKKPNQSKSIGQSHGSQNMLIVLSIFIVILLGALLTHILTGGNVSRQAYYAALNTPLRPLLIEVSRVNAPENGSSAVLQSDTSSNQYGFARVIPGLLRALSNTGLSDATDTPNPPGPGGGGGTGNPGQLAAIASWAGQITSKLEQVCGSGWNALNTPVNNTIGFSTGTRPATDCGSNGGAAGNKYWCADLVWHSYHLAGFTEVIQTPGVPSMHNWWRANPPGYYFIPYDGVSAIDLATLARIKPGCAIFYGSQSDPVSNRGEHIEIINTITVDGNRNGSISTHTANSSSITRTNAIAGGVVHSTHSYNVMGFGCHN